MQIFFVIGIIIFASLFFLMSLPIKEDWVQNDTDHSPSS